jgi:hypothetical protein
MRLPLVVPLALHAWATFALSGCALRQARPHPIVSVVGTSHETQETRSGALPGNLNAADTVRPILHTMWQRSRTFRAQCARIERTPLLHVVLRRVTATRAGTGGARTEFTRSNRRLHAEMIVSLDVGSSSLIELIAHEFEHVIEQLDGVQLTGRAQKGVSSDAGDTFETARAAHIGRQVALEVRRARNALLSVNHQ